MQHRYLPAFLLSIAINGAVLYGFDRAAYFSAAQTLKHEKRLALEKQRSELSFEFVEAPPKTRPEKPRKTKKISDRDALAQDQAAERANAGNSPAIPTLGVADQLYQHIGSKQSPASPKAELATTEEMKDKPENRDKEPEKKKSEKTSLDAFVKAPMETAAPEKEGDTIKVIEEQPPQEKRPRQSPKSEPKPPVKGIAGQARINTAEMAKHASVSAKFFGVTSFETTGSGMGEYMKGVKEKVWLAWFPYLSYKYPQDYRHADVVVSIRLDPNGDVKSLTVLDYEGDPLFADYCMNALQRANNFGKLPDEIVALLKDGELEIRFGFHYR